MIMIGMKQDDNSETVKKLETLLFQLGAMNDPPCFCCGYNGPGYFDVKVHPCADRSHKLYEGKGIDETGTL